jgi:hypothetical protein
MAKIKRLERYAITQREYHRHHQWVHDKGLYIPHRYSEEDSRPTWFDDVGFILNGRQVLVAFQHPRGVYVDKIEEIAFDIVGDLPEPGQLFTPEKVRWKEVGNSRKKVQSTTTKPMSDANSSYYERLNGLIAQMHKEGIEFDVSPRLKRSRLPTYTWVSICAPMEVHNKEQLAAVADLVRRILKGHTTLRQEFGDYKYTREDWKRDFAQTERKQRDRMQAESLQEAN